MQLTFFYGKFRTIFIGAIFSLLSIQTLNAHSRFAELGFEEGDLVFQMSQSSQSRALKEITQSVWTHMGVILKDSQGRLSVYEASNVVKFSSLTSWFAKGFDQQFFAMRVKKDVLDLSDSHKIDLLKNALLEFRGKSYDLWFQWSDDYIYCSELPWKAYQETFGLELGTLQRFRDMKLDGPEARKLIQERYIDEGRELNIDEIVITPISMFCSSKLEVVTSSDRVQPRDKYCEKRDL